MKVVPATIALALFLVPMLLIGCGSETPRERATDGRSGGDDATLSEFELEHGIGPIDEALALRGEDAYQMKCESCHRMEQRFVGPPMGDILERRSPEFVMNMMLNPAEMLQRHPVAQELLAEYMTPMPFQNVDQDEARAIVEYLRTVNN